MPNATATQASEQANMRTMGSISSSVAAGGRTVQRLRHLVGAALLWIFRFAEDGVVVLNGAAKLHQDGLWSGVILEVDVLAHDLPRPTILESAHFAGSGSVAQRAVGLKNKNTIDLVVFAVPFGALQLEIGNDQWRLFR